MVLNQLPITFCLFQDELPESFLHFFCLSKTLQTQIVNFDSSPRDTFFTTLQLLPMQGVLPDHLYHGKQEDESERVEENACLPQRF